MGKGKNNSLIDITIIICISFCMILLIHFIHFKFNEVMVTQDALITRDNQDEVIKHLFYKEIQKIKKTPSTMIEVYDENYNKILFLTFNEEYFKSEDINLKKNKSLKNLFGEFMSGYTRVDIDDIYQDVYFKWIDNDGERNLVIIYIAKPKIKHLWAVPVLCGIIVILIFILIFRMIINKQNIKLSQYKNIMEK